MLCAAILCGFHHLFFFLCIKGDSKCVFSHDDGAPLVHLQVQMAFLLDQSIVIRGCQCYPQMDYQLRYVIPHLIDNRAQLHFTYLISMKILNSFKLKLPVIIFMEILWKDRQYTHYLRIRSCNLRFSQFSDGAATQTPSH